MLMIDRLNSISRRKNTYFLFSDRSCSSIGVVYCLKSVSKTKNILFWWSRWSMIDQINLISKRKKYLLSFRRSLSIINPSVLIINRSTLIINQFDLIPKGEKYLLSFRWLMFIINRSKMIINLFSLISEREKKTLFFSINVDDRSIESDFEKKKALTFFSLIEVGHRSIKVHDRFKSIWKRKKILTSFPSYRILNSDLNTTCR